MVTRLNNLQGFVIPRGDQGASRFSLVEELLLGHFATFGMMTDEDKLNVAVFRTHKLIEEKKEVAGEILLHRIHRARHIHDAKHNSVGFRSSVGHHMPVDHVVFTEGEAVLLILLFSLRLLQGDWLAAWSLKVGFILPLVLEAPLSGQAPSDTGERRTFFVEA